MTGALAHLEEPVGREAAATPALLPSGYLLAALALLVISPAVAASSLAAVAVSAVSRRPP